jgi:hypothetical protein
MGDAGKGARRGKGLALFQRALDHEVEHVVALRRSLFVGITVRVANFIGGFPFRERYDVCLILIASFDHHAVAGSLVVAHGF